MASAHQSSETGVWSVNGHSIRVEYWASVLEEIRAAAVAGYCQFPRGGVEVGGVLFGRLEGGATRIVACRPVPCEYKFGPSFQLSEKDDRAFAEALQAAKSDPLLAGLEPVGWYHSHTRNGICLTELDLELHNRHFQKLGQVALVVRPESFGPSKAGFFFREADGTIRAESSYNEFALAARGRKPKSAPREERPAPSQPERASSAAVVPKVITPAVAHTDHSRRKSVLAAALVFLVVIGGTAAFLMMRGKSAPPSLALSALDVGGQLQIAWDRDASAVRQAASGSLEIVDGGKKLVLPFTASGLRRGSVTYARTSGNVEIRLTVNPMGTSPVEELVKFIGSTPAPAPTPEVAPPNPVEPPPAQEATEQPPAAPVRQPAPRRRESKKKKGRQRAEIVVPRGRAAPARRLQVASAHRPLQMRPLGQPPSLQPGSPSTAAVAVALPRAESTAAPPSTAPAPKPQAAKTGYAGPTSGRLIWTGRLGKGQSVLIDGAGASSGYLTGTLPGVPVRISAHPADLSDGGMVVYTASAVAARSAFEAPGPHNGWNPTRYTRDPHRAARVLVTAPPSAQTGWKRLTLLSDEAPVAVVIIDWKVVE